MDPCKLVKFLFAREVMASCAGNPWKRRVARTIRMSRRRRSCSFLVQAMRLRGTPFPVAAFWGGWYDHTVDGTNPAANGKYLVIHRVSYMSAGAGFFPSTVLALYNLHLSRCMWWYLFNFRVLDLKILKGTVPTFSAKSSLF